MNRLRVIFAGTPEFAAPSLRALLDDPAIDVCAVYTQPDRPAGRGRKLTMSPVKQLAIANERPIRQPQTFKDASAIHEFKALEAELLIVAAYGLILPVAALSAVRYPLNVHASLLPRWRGAAPIQRAIMAGDTETGISIMRVVEKLDAGPVWLTRACTISDNETGGSLHDKLADLGAVTLIEAIQCYRDGVVNEMPQKENLVTYAEKVTASDRDIEWRDSATAIDRRIRALMPQPGARFRLHEQSVKIIEGYPSARSADAQPGTVLRADAEGLVFQTGNGTYTITRLQPPGKTPMTAAAFVNGYGKLL